MLQLITTDLQNISSKHGLSLAEIKATSLKIPEYLKKIHARKQGFYTDEVLEDRKLLADIQNFTKSRQGQYDYIVVLGIGGSALGPIALREAFGNIFTGTKPKLIVLDNIDPDLIAEAKQFIRLEKTLFLVITKSGGTPETLSHYFYFAQKIQEAGLDEKKHFVFITDPTKGFLREQANLKNIPTFPVPPNVGGRFSVQTVVGLLPASLIGINIEQFLAGMMTIREAFLSEDFDKNLPFQLAAIQYLLYQKGKTQNVIYPYAQKLYRIADWCRQLIAESTGKRYSEDQKEIHTGITPIASLGSTDQHSQNQLYFEGPNDKLFIFLEIEQFANKLPIPLLHPDDPRVNYLNQTDFGQLLNLEKAGTAGALTEVQRPHLTIKIPKIAEKYIGQIMMLFEGATAFLGEFLKINAFDQPGVELSKNITKKLLQH